MRLNMKNKILNLFDRTNQFLNRIFNSKAFNISCIIIGIAIIILYLGLYFFKQPIVNEEVLPEVTNNLIPWEVKNGDNFFVAMLTRPFNLHITEYGQYRPRYLAFLVQFLDENIFLHITRAFPIWGNRLLFYILAMFLTVASIYQFIRTVWNKMPKGLAFLISTSIIMFQNYQVTTYWRARSAKLLAVSACIFLITHMLKKINVEFKKQDWKKLLISIPIFMLMTLDEQVLAMAFLILGISILFSIINRKINISSLIYLIACFLYGTFHLWWGKSLFLKYTGELQKHGHTIGGSIKGISIDTLKESLEILMFTIPKIIFLSVFLFIIIYIYSFIKIIINKDNKKEKISKLLTALFISGSAVIILMLMIDAHNPIYTIPCLWKSVYPLIATIILFLGLIYVMSKSEYKYNNFKYLILLIGIFVSLGYNISNVNSYYGAYLDIKGGFRDNSTDLIITKDEILTKVVKTDYMDYDNDSLIAVLNTGKATTDIKTTKIIGGLYNDNYINDEFSCYLKVGIKRTLKLNLIVKDYKKIDFISIYINDVEKENIKVNSNNIRRTIFVSPEVYRACKITIKVHTKDNYKLTKKDIQIKELTME